MKNHYLCKYITFIETCSAIDPPGRVRGRMVGRALHYLLGTRFVTLKRNLVIDGDVKEIDKM